MIREFKYWYHLIPIIFKMARGNWYIFRDCPTWVIDKLLAEQQGIPEDESYNDTRSLVAQAQAEKNLRLRKEILKDI